MGQGVFCPLSKICRCTGQNSGGFPDRLGWLFNQAGGRPGHKKIPLKRNGFKGICYGAARQIRTADLILTNKGLCFLRGFAICKNHRKHLIFVSPNLYSVVL